MYGVGAIISTFDFFYLFIFLSYLATLLVYILLYLYLLQYMYTYLPEDLTEETTIAWSLNTFTFTFILPIDIPTLQTNMAINHYTFPIIPVIIPWTDEPMNQ